MDSTTDSANNRRLKEYYDDMNNMSINLALR